MVTRAYTRVLGLVERQLLLDVYTGHLRRKATAMTNPFPNLYSGRVGHDASEGFCSCGGFHYPEDNIRVGTKTVLVQADDRNKQIEWDADDPTIAFESEHGIK